MSDSIDELARRLFEAARAERPDAALIARVRNPSDAALAPQAERTEPESGARLVRLPQRRFPRLRWLAAAAVLAGAALLAFGRDPAPDARVSISAEAQPPARPSAAAPESAPAPFESGSAPKAGPPMAALPRAASPAPLRAPERHERSSAMPAEAPPETPLPAAAAAPGAAAPRSAPLAAQLEQLKRARALLRAGDGAGALDAVERYGSELHGADLKDEADVLRIEALSALGRKSEAAERARRFVLDHPDSPLAERAQRYSVDLGTAPARERTP